jgi:hypothetical protein
VEKLEGQDVNKYEQKRKLIVVRSENKWSVSTIR